jgi:hypothetical protein
MSGAFLRSEVGILDIRRVDDAGKDEDSKWEGGAEKFYISLRLSGTGQV